jgi:two-component system, OmpR family, response regulator PrrA
VAQILLIEDDPAIRSRLIHALSELGYAVTSTGQGMSGLAMAVESSPDMVLLDLGLPDIDGTDVLVMLRAVSSVPVIITSARDDDPGLVRALDNGADDYVVKPFTASQLDARIRAVLRRTRSGENQRNVLSVGGLSLDLRARVAELDGIRLELSPREFDLLAYLAQRSGEVVSKRQLLTDVWQRPYGGSDKTVDVHLSWLRRKLGETADRPRMLHSVRGVGIRLEASP